MAHLDRIDHDSQVETRTDCEAMDEPDCQGFHSSTSMTDYDVITVNLLLGKLRVSNVDSFKGGGTAESGP